MKKVVLVLNFIPALLSAQCTIEVVDTFLCTPGSMLVLDAVTFDALILKIMQFLIYLILRLGIKNSKFD